MENSKWQLFTLFDEQKSWLIDARAIGLTFEQITDHFKERFTERKKEGRDRRARELTLV